MAGMADIPAFRSMRTLRALRPLRAVSRWEGMKVSNMNHHFPKPMLLCNQSVQKNSTLIAKLQKLMFIFLSRLFPSTLFLFFLNMYSNCISLKQNLQCIF